MPIATISVNFASLAEIQAGTTTAKSINPSNLKSALQSGTSLYNLDINGISLNAPLSAANGTVTSPSITFDSDTNTGIYRPAADTLGFVEGGNEVIRITSTGTVGVNKTTNIDYAVDVNGDVRANFFRGSGRFLTDVLAVTGGAINISVGTGAGKFIDLEAAFQALSSLILTPDATVNINLDPGTYTHTSSFDISHPNGSRINVYGAPVTSFYSVRGSATSCILGVSGRALEYGTPVGSITNLNLTPAKTAATIAASTARISPLSAEFTYDSSLTDPSVGQYMLCHSVSGRNAHVMVGLYRINSSGGNLVVVPGAVGGGSSTGLSVLSSPSTFTRHYPGDTLLTTASPGCKMIITQFVTGSAHNLVRTIVDGNISNPGSCHYEFSETGLGPFSVASLSAFNCMVVTGTPDSFRGTGFKQAPCGNTINTGAVLTFSDSAATSTYLNPGDYIVAMGQMRAVSAVS